MPWHGLRHLKRSKVFEATRVQVVFDPWRQALTGRLFGQRDSTRRVRRCGRFGDSDIYGQMFRRYKAVFPWHCDAVVDGPARPTLTAPYTP